ncbi:MAG: hypothetical protein V3U54_08475 [Thermodesulfobacteriota bacterium]
MTISWVLVLLVMSSGGPFSQAVEFKTWTECYDAKIEMKAKYMSDPEKWQDVHAECFEVRRDK